MMAESVSTPQTELHRHLDVSTRPETVYELAQKLGLEPQSTSFEAFREKLIMREPMKDLSSVLAQFTLFQKVLDRPETIERVGYEVVEDCHREGTRKVELRFSASFVTQYNSLSWEDVLDAFDRGISRALQRYPDMKAGMLLIASRDFGPDAAAETVEFYLKHRKRFIGLDLAGPEKEYPGRLFEEAFRPLKAAMSGGDAGVHLTVHAGEGAGPESMWQAIEGLGAQRIGHGIRCVEDPKLMDYLARKEICLEVCPTSNWLTGVITEFEDHPLPRILAADIPACINTDDPGIFGVTLPGEIAICREKMGLSDADIARCHEFASCASFISN